MNKLTAVYEKHGLRYKRTNEPRGRHNNIILISEDEHTFTLRNHYSDKVKNTTFNYDEADQYAEWLDEQLTNYNYRERSKIQRRVNSVDGIVGV